MAAGRRHELCSVKRGPRAPLVPGQARLPQLQVRTSRRIPAQLGPAHPLCPPPTHLQPPLAGSGRPARAKGISPMPCSGQLAPGGRRTASAAFYAAGRARADTAWTEPEPQGRNHGAGTAGGPDPAPAAPPAASAVPALALPSLPPFAKPGARSVLTVLLIVPKTPGCSTEHPHLALDLWGAQPNRAELLLLLSSPFTTACDGLLDHSTFPLAFPVLSQPAEHRTPKLLWLLFTIQ